MNRLKDILRDQPLSSLTRQNVVTFFDTLQKLPPNINKNPLYKDCSVEQILRMKLQQEDRPENGEGEIPEAKKRAFSSSPVDWGMSVPTCCVVKWGGHQLPGDT